MADDDDGEAVFPLSSYQPPTQRPGDWRRRSSSERTTANKNRAISHAARLALTELFPSCAANFDERLAAVGQVKGDTSTHAVVGRGAAQRVVAARRDDGPNQGGGYVDTSGYGRSAR